ncbi:related to cobalt accumulation protein COT1 [Fusarium oxysporum]|uniref:Related to cobalt accumulation protein COT1 n=1 Tax=Fusarium oxysporum TaxID=5507 RepID=A0A2H3T8F6_FUSOX|nr:related to cobalt accumulation protein COT1 [Fusarium oxysporum]
MGVLQKMAWSKSTRIKVMIAIDTLFFLVEIVSGFLAHSLALMADAFHMLNDIISLVIGLWAVSAAQKTSTDEFTFGWVRAEILGAFFNAVFLIALCVSIVLEALTRFIEPPEINNPKLMLIVGSAGLFSNFVGFFVLGGHGHSHGPGEHDHDHDHGHSHAHAHDEEEGNAGYQTQGTLADESGRAAEVLPEAVFRRATASKKSNGKSSEQRHSRDASTRGRDYHRSGRSGHARFASLDDLSIHPASFRQSIIEATRGETNESTSESETDAENSLIMEEDEAHEESPLLKDVAKKGSSLGHNRKGSHSHSHSHSHSRRPRRDSSVHHGHHHTLPKKAGKKDSHGHNHADMGMNAMILHVIGDMLGNIGVMVTALIIWLTDWPGKVYADPAVSLFITAIILKTCIPLTRGTARVLLQATPEHISVPEIRQDIEALPGVITCHHIHVWQLSDTKLVASMHLQVSFPIDSHSGEKYMELARRARKCLHGFGIHSATIQPEFCFDQKHSHDAEAAALSLDGPADLNKGDSCLLECIDDCQAQGCCPADSSSKASSTRRCSESSHSATSPHAHDHDHSHDHGNNHQH